MSRTTLYTIRKNGRVAFEVEVNNAWGWCPAIWDWFREKYNCGGRSALDDEALKRVWKLFKTPALTDAENLLLGATFDRVWVRRERVSALCDALEVFHDHLMSTKPGFAQTARGVALGAREALTKFPTMLGVCFQGTSVSEDQWSNRKGGLINILRTPNCVVDGLPHWEIDS